MKSINRGTGKKMGASIADTVMFIIYLHRYVNTNLLYDTIERWMIPNEMKQRCLSIDNLRPCP
jgi:hypothetical protein